MNWKFLSLLLDIKSVVHVVIMYMFCVFNIPQFLIFNTVKNNSIYCVNYTHHFTTSLAPPLFVEVPAVPSQESEQSF